MLPVRRPGWQMYRRKGLRDLEKMDVMGSSNKQSTPESLIVTRSEELVD